MFIILILLIVLFFLNTTVRIDWKPGCFVRKCSHREYRRFKKYWGITRKEFKGKESYLLNSKFTLTRSITYRVKRVYYWRYLIKMDEQELLSKRVKNVK